MFLKRLRSVSLTTVHKVRNHRASDILCKKFTDKKFEKKFINNNINQQKKCIQNKIYKKMYYTEKKILHDSRTIRVGAPRVRTSNLQIMRKTSYQPGQGWRTDSQYLVVVFMLPKYCQKSSASDRDKKNRVTFGMIQDADPEIFRSTQPNITSKKIKAWFSIFQQLLRFY